MKTIEDLLKIGFKKVGNWQLDPEKRIKYVVDSEYLILEHLLYAFESEDIVKYIGITEKTLNNRLINYKNAREEIKTAGSTNKKINNEIKELLKKTAVNIYILKNIAPCDFYGYEISLATGIEKSLISAFDNNNLWNNRGTKNAPKNENYITNKVKSNINLQNNQTVIKLGKEAMNKGFILFKNDVDELLPEDSDDMDIHYNNEIINGWFTRSSTNKKTNGYKRLKEIFNSDFKLNNEILITVLNKNEIKIEKKYPN